MNEVIVSNVISMTVVMVGFIGNALYLRGKFGERLKNVQEDVRDLKDSVRYKDTCDSTVHEFNTRVSSLETVRNGK